MSGSMKIWDIYAPVYDIFMAMNRGAYEKIYRRIRKVIAGRDVLELAAGTGLITKHTASAAKSYTATDLSDNMLKQACRGEHPEGLRIMKADAADVPFPDSSFDAVIISNALHVIPEPERVLAEIKRVLRPDGVLIAPNFIHHTDSVASRMMSDLLSAAGVVFTSAWDRYDYAAFLESNGFRISNSGVLKASIPLMYTESRLKK